MMEDRFRLVVVGGGVAALELVLALRETLSRRLDISLVAPSTEFGVRAMAVATPFGYSPPEPLSLNQLADELGAEYRRDAFRGIDPNRKVAQMESGEETPYDALAIAIGAQPIPAIPGAITYRGVLDNPEIGALLGEAERGELERIAFAIPASAHWPLPIYELALQTARWLPAAAGEAPRVTLVTHEAAPLAIFGARASEQVRELLDRAAVELISDARAATTGDGGLLLDDGRLVRADRIVAQPRLTVPPLVGVPQLRDGFIPTDAQMRVPGVERVYAAGDATWFPIKQGGVAAAQADAVASSVAALIEPEREVTEFQPTLRGVLFTGGAPRYLRSGIEGDESATSTGAPLWFPPAKVAGRYLAPYLMKRSGHPNALEDLDPGGGEESSTDEADHEDALALALASADADALWDDFRGAQRWLDVAEDLNIVLPSSYAAKRQRWSVTRGRRAG